MQQARLQSELETRGLEASGNKPALVNRLHIALTAPQPLQVPSWFGAHAHSGTTIPSAHFSSAGRDFMRAKSKMPCLAGCPCAACRRAGPSQQRRMLSLCICVRWCAFWLPALPPDLSAIQHMSRTTYASMRRKITALQAGQPLESTQKHAPSPPGRWWRSTRSWRRWSLPWRRPPRPACPSGAPSP